MSNYDSRYRSNSKRAANAMDLTVLSLIDFGWSYSKIAAHFGVSKQRIGQRVAKMGIYKDKNKIPKKYRKVAA